MKRLVYAPRVSAYVKGREDKIYDISKYVVSGNVHRVTDQASTAEIVLRNPEKIFTPLGNPFFLPMDPITIYLQRISGHPIRVFTGFLDETPYYQMYPGTLKLNASCTLKKLLYTFWNAALPYVTDVMTNLGWAVSGNGLLIKPDEQKFQTPGNLSLTDGSMGALLFYILKNVGGWKPENILIEPLPETLIPFITSVYQEFEEGEKDQEALVKGLMDSIIGAGAYGDANLGGGSSGGTGTGSDSGGSGSTYSGPLDRRWPRAVGVGAPCKSLTSAQVKQIAIDEGATEVEATVIDLIAEAESGRCPGRVNASDNGIGLVQMTPGAGWHNSGPYYDKMNDLGGYAAMANPVLNIRLTMYILRYNEKHGIDKWSPWNGDTGLAKARAQGII